MLRSLGAEWPSPERKAGERWGTRAVCHTKLLAAAVHSMIRHLLCAVLRVGQTAALQATLDGVCCKHTVSSLILVSNQVGSPAELKHIIKRRKRN